VNQPYLSDPQPNSQGIGTEILEENLRAEEAEAKRLAELCPRCRDIESRVATLIDPDASDKAQFTDMKDFQRAILSTIIMDRETLVWARNLIKPEYFANLDHRTICRLAFHYFDKYDNIPSEVFLLNELELVIKDRAKALHAQVEAKVVRDCFHPGLDGQQVICDRIAAFARMEALRLAFLKSWDILGQGYHSPENWKQCQEEIEKVFAIRAPTSTTIVARNWPEIVAIAREGFDWFIKDYLPVGTVKMISGMGKDGKTTFVAGTVVDCIYDASTMGLPARSEPTVWLDFDDNPLWHPVEMMLTAIGDREQQPFCEKFRMFSGQFESGTASSLPPYLTVEWLQECCLANIGEKGGLIVLDSFRPAFMRQSKLEAGWDKDPHLVGNLLRPFVQWCHKNGRTMVIIHHDNRAGKYAGSNEFINAVDSMDHFERVDEHRDDLRILRTIGGRGVPLSKRLLRFEDGLYYLTNETEAEAKRTTGNSSRLAHLLVEVAGGRVVKEKDEYYKAAQAACQAKGIEPLTAGVTLRDVRKLVGKFIDRGILVKTEGGYTLADEGSYSTMLALLLEEMGV